MYVFERLNNTIVIQCGSEREAKDLIPLLQAAIEQAQAATPRRTAVTANPNLMADVGTRISDGERVGQAVMNAYGPWHIDDTGRGVWIDLGYYLPDVWEVDTWTDDVWIWVMDYSARIN